ncbi:MAG: hypothetical protein IPP74_03140 [Alphaproteobacteria bacterium]|nr:hypothetical protein [Alphaproteobacteria bacterium]
MMTSIARYRHPDGIDEKYLLHAEDLDLFIVPMRWKVKRYGPKRISNVCGGTASKTSKLSLE